MLRYAGTALALTGAVLGIYGGGSEKVGGRVRNFSALSLENPRNIVAAQGENGGELPGMWRKNAGHRRVAGRESRSRVRHPLRCTAADWRAYATPGERWIIARESGGNVRAWNRVATPTGHAFGLGQLTDATRARIALRLRLLQLSTNACDQLAMMRAYIAERYGSTSAAVAFWRRHGWY